MRVLLLTLLLSTFAPARAADKPAERPAVQREMQLVYVFEGTKPEYVFVIGQSGFKTVAALEEHLKTWPRGSELRWAPGCERFGGEPLLSSEDEMKAFREFLDRQGIRFVLVPSG